MCASSLFKCMMHAVDCNKLFRKFGTGWIYHFLAFAHLYIHRRCANNAGLLFPSQYLHGTILLSMYSIMWDWRVLRAGPMFFLFSKAASSFFIIYCFLFAFFLGAGVFWLIRCQSLSPGRALPTFLNYNANNNSQDRFLLISQSNLLQSTPFKYIFAVRCMDFRKKWRHLDAELDENVSV